MHHKLEPEREKRILKELKEHRFLWNISMFKDNSTSVFLRWFSYNKQEF